MNLYEQQKRRVEQNIQKSYGDLELQKQIEGDLLEKGKRANIGETREWKGGKYVKTAQGWKPVGEVDRESEDSSEDKRASFVKKLIERDSFARVGIDYLEANKEKMQKLFRVDYYSDDRVVFTKKKESKNTTTPSTQNLNRFGKETIKEINRSIGVDGEHLVTKQEYQKNKSFFDKFYETNYDGISGGKPRYKITPKSNGLPSVD